MKTEYIWKEGDEFKIKQKKVTGRYKCRYPNKTYIINSLDRYYGSQKSLILYKDNRTNIKCLCSQCNEVNKKYWDYSKKETIDTGLKSIWSEDIILVRTKAQRQRDISLKILNI